MITVPLVRYPSQQVRCVLGGQDCLISVYQKAFGLFVDLYVANRLIVGGVLAQNCNLIVRSVYLGFVGDLFFYDTLSDDDPEWSELDGRFLLVYLDAEETALQVEYGDPSTNATPPPPLPPTRMNVPAQAEFGSEPGAGMVEGGVTPP